MWYQNGQLRVKELQECLDFLSYSTNLPLRILDVDALQTLPLDRIWHLTRDETTTQSLDLGAFRSQMQSFLADTDADDTVDVLSQVPKLLGPPSPVFSSAIDELEQKIWLTRTANPLPIADLFRLCDEWRWFVLCWYKVELENIIAAADATTRLPAFYLPAWTKQYHWIDLGAPRKQHRGITETGV